MDVPDANFNVVLLFWGCLKVFGIYVVTVLPTAMGIKVVKSAFAYMGGDEYR
jgi:hypothetical protein